MKDLATLPDADLHGAARGQAAFSKRCGAFEVAAMRNGLKLALGSLGKEPFQGNRQDRRPVDKRRLERKC